MARYIVQHRRGTASQWAAQNTIIPKVGEIVIEIDEENSLHKLKIGDGVHTYSELAYLMAGDEVVTQVLSMALPRVITVTLDVDEWEEVTSESDPNLGYYSQPVSIDNITEYSRLDLQPNADMLAEFQNLNLVFVTENKNGVITVHSVGDMPLKSYTMQATVVETELHVDKDHIVGTPVGTPTAKSDWNQTDETKADYIKNKPQILTEEDILNLIGDNGDIVIQQVQPDWNQTDDTKADYIKNKPGILTEDDLKSKADKTEVETALQGKVDNTTFNNEISNIVDTIETKADISDVATKASQEDLDALRSMHYDTFNALQYEINGKIDKTYVDNTFARQIDVDSQNSNIAALWNETGDINKSLGSLAGTLDEKVNKSDFQNLYETHWTHIHTLEDTKIDRSEFENKNIEFTNALYVKADKDSLLSKMDKVFGTSDQYAGFDGIAPNVIPVSPDTTPTENSTKLITSGAVYEALQDVGTGGNSGVYVGEGDMPEDCVLQFDFTGKPVTLEEIANTVYTMAQSYIDEQLGVIENGSY